MKDIPITFDNGESIPLSQLLELISGNSSEMFDKMTPDQFRIVFTSFCSTPRAGKIDNESLAKYFLAKGTKEQEKDEKRAIDDFTKAIIANPRFDVPWLFRARSYWSLKKYDAAINDIVEYLCLLPDDPQGFGYRVLYSISLESGDIDKFFQGLSVVMKRNPENVEPYLARSEIEIQDEKWDEALKSLTKAIELKLDADLYYKRAFVYENLGMLYAAISDCQMYLELSDSSIENRAEVENIIIEIQKELDPQEMMVEGKVLAEDQRKYRMAGEHALNAIESKDGPKSASEFLRIISDPSKHEKVINESQLAINLVPTLTLPYKNLFHLYAHKKDWEKAIDYISTVILIDHSDGSAYGDRGAAYYSLNKYDEAIQDLQFAIRLDPENILAYQNLGAAYWRKGNYKEVFAPINKVLEQNPYNTLAIICRANSYENLGDIKSAIADYQKYIDLGGGPEIQDLNVLKEHIKTLANS